MKSIDVHELSERSVIAQARGETLAVERDGEVIGYFIPRKKKDPEKIRKAFEKFDRAIENALANGLTREELDAIFDLSKPFPYDD